MTVVRSLADELFHGVIGHAEAAAALVIAHVAVLLTVGDDIVIQRQEALRVGLIAVLFRLGAFDMRGGGGAHQRGTGHARGNDSR